MRNHLRLTASFVILAAVAGSAVATPADAGSVDRSKRITRSIVKEAKRTATIRVSRGVEVVRAVPAGHQRGMASYYWQGQVTANGERFNPEGMTAAHRTLRIGTMVRVQSQRTGRAVVVRINDRGPFIGGRIVDLSRGAARQIGMIDSGVAPVTLTVLR